MSSEQPDAQLELTPAQDSYAPGDMIRGRLAWRLSKAPTQPELRLYWYTEGKGTQDVVLALSLALPPDRLSYHQEFSLAVPAHPLSYRGKLLSISWALELIGLPGVHLAPVPLLIGLDGQPAQAVLTK